jgi:hypothetical protein
LDAEAGNEEFFELDAPDIIGFCRESMGIYDFELTTDQLEGLGFTYLEKEIVLIYLLHEAQVEHIGWKYLW